MRRGRTLRLTRERAGYLGGENGCEEGHCEPGWKSGEQQNQAGRRNRNEKGGQKKPAGEGARRQKVGQGPTRETGKELEILVLKLRKWCCHSIGSWN